MEISNTYRDLFPYYLDSEFCNQAHLTHLFLNITKLQSPLENLGFFSELKEAGFFSRNPIPSYKFLKSLATLKILYLHAELNYLPEELRQLTALEELDLSYNKITELPDWIANLPRLRSIIIDRPPYKDGEGSDSRSSLFTLTEYPPALRNCPVLVYCSLGVPARSLTNLPSNARYWAALAFAMQGTFHTEKIAFDLPEIVRERVNEEFPEGVNVEYEANRIMEWASYNPERMSYVRQFDMPPPNIPHIQISDHPQLMAWLDAFYADTYEIMFERVRNGAVLNGNQHQRFIHETTYQYYQLLCNTTQTRIDPAMMDDLAGKFSVRLNDTTRVLL